MTDVARIALERSPPGHSPDHQPTVAGHLLEEWIAFAKNELEAPVDALTPEHVRLLPELEKVFATVARLLAEGFIRACADIGASTPRQRDDELHAAPPKDSWLSERGFKLYAKYVPLDGFGDVTEPCFVVGAWIEGETAVAARSSREFHTTLGERGLAAWDEDDRHGGWIEFGVAVALSELAGHATLEEQDEAFGHICLCALRALAAPLD